MPIHPFSLAPLVVAVAALSGCASPRFAPEAPFPIASMPSPVPHDAADQRLSGNASGDVVLSWWHSPPKDGKTLSVSVLRNGNWAEPQPVNAHGNVVEAQVIPAADNQLAALWMLADPAQSGEGEAHTVWVARSQSAGETWSAPLKLNRESETSAKESPAFTLTETGDLLAAWIDQRHYRMIPPTKPGEPPKEEGFSALIATSVSADQRLGPELLVDKDFCSCCAPTLTSDGQGGGLMAYREHQADNVRDPAVMSITASRFGAPKIVNPDHWVIEGCPARGPVISEADGMVGVAWLTSINDKFRIRTVFSGDQGLHFGQPIDVELENAVGVSGIEMEDANSALVAWTRSAKDGETTQLARVFTDGRVEHRTTVHALTKGGAYKWPGPRMAKNDEAVFIGWNDEQGKKLGIVRVQTAP